jgi:hypothetical protein
VLAEPPTMVVPSGTMLAETIVFAHLFPLKE